MVGNIKLNYEIKKIIINKDNLDKFVVDDSNRRKIRDFRVQKLFSILDADEHFETGFMVNEVNNKYRLIDGNHRYEAIKLFLKKHPERSIEVNLSIYYDLTREQESLMFNKWNLGLKVSILDFIQQHKDDIGIFYDVVNKDFSCNIQIYPNNKSFTFYNLISAYYSATHGNIFIGGWIGGGEKFVEYSKSLNNYDITIIKDFINDFQNVFGKVEGLNRYCKTSIFMPLFRLWYDNVHNAGMTSEDFNRMMESKIFGSQRVLEFSRLGGRGSSQLSRKIMLELLNEKRNKNLFI